MQPIGTLPTNQPTNLPTDVLPDDPVSYVSIRINIPHDAFEYLRDKVLHGSDYVAYPHLGAHRNNAHFHVFVPSTSGKKLAERLRKRIKDNYPDLGNQFYSVKLNNNGMLCAIQYGSKEGTEPICSSDDMRLLVSRAPEWVPQGGQRLLPLNKADKAERDWILTYSNMVPQAVQYARRVGLTCGLKATVQHMMEHSRWRPSNQMRVHGVHCSYSSDFEYRVGKRKHQDMDWWTPKFS